MNADLLRMVVDEQLATRIVAVRHGETSWNVQRRIQGQLDVPLNDLGHWQALRLGEALASEGVSAIYSSDLQRASSTAAAIGRACRLSVAQEPGLRERCFGVFEGWTWADVETRWPADSALWRARDLDFAPSGGESLPVFSARVLAACTRLAAAHPGECIALVAHGGVMDCLHRAATRVGLGAKSTWSLANAAVNRLLYTREGFCVVGWGDVSHLADAVASSSTSDGSAAGLRPLDLSGGVDQAA